jgi:hypothetical protein
LESLPWVAIKARSGRLDEFRRADYLVCCEYYRNKLGDLARGAKVTSSDKVTGTVGAPGTAQPYRQTLVDGSQPGGSDSAGGESYRGKP